MAYATQNQATSRSAWVSQSRSDPRWLGLYRRVLTALAVYGLVVFPFVDAVFEVWLEAAFFLAVFAALIWPLCLDD